MKTKPNNMSRSEEPVIVMDSDFSGVWGLGSPELLQPHLGGSPHPLSPEGPIPAA